MTFRNSRLLRLLSSTAVCQLQPNFKQAVSFKLNLTAIESKQLREFWVNGKSELRILNKHCSWLGNYRFINAIGTINFNVKKKRFTEFHYSQTSTSEDDFSERSIEIA